MKFERTYTLAEIATIANAEIIKGQETFAVNGINEIHMVEAGDLTFVDHPKYYSKALNSAATIVLLNNKETECPEGKALLYSEDPFAAYIQIVRHFRTFQMALSLISATAVIGKNTVIQPGAFIGNHVKIGDNCVIHANASIYDYSEIGNNCIIHSNTVIGADAYYFQRKLQGYRKMESCGIVKIADSVEIGALCSIDKGVSGTTFIGKGTKMDNHVQVGHDTYIGENCLIGSHCAIAGVTRIEDDVILWGRVSVNKDLVIGKGAILLATSAVDKNVEGGKTYFGAPAIEVRKAWREMAAIRQLPKIIAKMK